MRAGISGLVGRSQRGRKEFFTITYPMVWFDVKETMERGIASACRVV